MFTFFKKEFEIPSTSKSRNEKTRNFIQHAFSFYKAFQVLMEQEKKMSRLMTSLSGMNGGNAAVNLLQKYENDVQKAEQSLKEVFPGFIEASIALSYLYQLPDRCFNDEIIPTVKLLGRKCKDYIRRFLIEKKDKAWLEAALNQNKSLHHIFRVKRGVFACQVGKGCLGEIQEKLWAIQQPSQTSSAIKPTK